MQQKHLTLTGFESTPFHRASWSFISYVTKLQNMVTENFPQKSCVGSNRVGADESSFLDLTIFVTRANHIQ